MCGHHWHVLPPFPVSYSEKEKRWAQGRNCKSKRIWIHVQVILMYHIFSAYPPYPLRLFLWAGHSSPPWWDLLCHRWTSRNWIQQTPPTTHSNVRWRKKDQRLKVKTSNTIYAKNCLHRGMWNGQQYSRTLLMLMHSVIPLRNNIFKLPLMWMRSMV